MCTLNHAIIWWVAALISTSSLITDPASVPAWIVTEQIGQEFLHCLGYARQGTSCANLYDQLNGAL